MAITNTSVTFLCLLEQKNGTFLHVCAFDDVCFGHGKAVWNSEGEGECKDSFLWLLSP